MACGICNTPLDQPNNPAPLPIKTPVCLRCNGFVVVPIRLRLLEETSQSPPSPPPYKKNGITVERCIRIVVETLFVVNELQDEFVAGESDSLSLYVTLRRQK